MKDSSLSDVEIEFIKNEIIKKKRLNIDIDKYRELDKENIELLIDCISDYIGYDSKNDDIDEIGRFADNIIGKLLVLSEQRDDI